jgi:hypothetical protein
MSAQEGRVEEALQSFRKAVAAGGTCPQAAQALQELQARPKLPR